jgi:SatD family (SatD)
MAASKQQRKPCIAIIVDMVKSRDLSGKERPGVQERFQALVKHLNKHYAQHILSEFVITLGDEFQGLMRSGDCVPRIIWDLEDNFPDRALRSGIGFGPLYTPAPKLAINVDGPCLHKARSAIEKAKRDSLLGGVFDGFGALDTILNGLARLLWFHRSSLTEQQRAIFRLLRDGATQLEVANTLQAFPQVVSKQVKAAGWQPYLEGESAWGALFETYVQSMIGTYAK